MGASACSHSLPTNELTRAIIAGAMKVHSALGPGRLESAYKACLAHELRSGGLTLVIEAPQPVVCDGVKLDVGYRIDLLVEGRVIVEVKSVEGLHPIHAAQLLSYMRLGGVGVGLLINFNVLHLKDGIQRLVDGHEWNR